MPDTWIKEYAARQHANALATIKLWSNISKGVVSDRSRELATQTVINALATNSGVGWMCFSEETRAAFVQFQLDAWSGRAPTAKTLEYVADFCPTFSPAPEPYSQDRNVRKSV
jgi:hypothetical protein